MRELLKVKQFICNKCLKVFSKKSILLRHSLVHNRSAAAFRCTQCFRAFTQNVALKKHLKNSVCLKKSLKNLNQVSNTSEESCEEEPVEEKKSVCPYCDRSFLKPSDCDRHILTHTNERKFKCIRDDCNKTFKLKNTLERHLKTHERQTFTCKSCSSTYKSLKALQYHMRLHSSRHTFTVIRTNSQPNPSRNESFGKEVNEIPTTVN